MYDLDYLNENSFSIHNGLEKRRDNAIYINKNKFGFMYIAKLNNIDRKIEHQYPRGYWKLFLKANKEFIDDNAKDLSNE